MYYLRKKRFASMLEKMEDVKSREAELDALLAGYPEKYKEEVKKIWPVLLKIMNARSSDDLTGISIKEAAECFQHLDIFDEIYGEGDSYTWFQWIKHKLAQAKSCRTRRVL